MPPMENLAVLDRTIPIIAALVISALLLLAATTAMGWNPESALGSMLATVSALGGPAGKLGGLAVMGGLCGISYVLGRFALVRKFESHVVGLSEKGVSANDILTRIALYPISKGLKRRLRMSIRNS